MIYLIVKMLVLLLIAGGAGAAFGWLMREAHEREAREANEAEAAARLAELRAARDAAEAKLLAALDAPATAPEQSPQLAPALPSEPDPEMAEKLAAAAKTLEASDAALAEAAAALRAADARASKAEQRIAELEAGASTPSTVDPNTVDPNMEAPPPAITEPDDGGDDLRQISGVGPKIETILHENGIWRFSQIAEMTPGQVAWLDDKLTFRGRIEREDWIGQAKTLADSKA